MNGYCGDHGLYDSLECGWCCYKILKAERDRLKNHLEMIMSAHSPKCFSEIDRLKAELEKRFVIHDPYNCEYVAETYLWKSKAKKLAEASKKVLDSLVPNGIYESGCGLELQEALAEFEKGDIGQRQQPIKDQ